MNNEQLYQQRLRRHATALCDERPDQRIWENLAVLENTFIWQCLPGL